MTRCSDCAQPLAPSLPGEPRPWFRVDGTRALICNACVREAVNLAEQRDYNDAVARRIAELGR